jgi:hypothetical protein
MIQALRTEVSESDLGGFMNPWGVRIFQRFSPFFDYGCWASYMAKTLPWGFGHLRWR